MWSYKRAAFLVIGLLPALCRAAANSTTLNEEGWRQDLIDWMLTGLKPPTYETDLNNVKFGYIFRRDATNVRDDAVNALICSVCEVAVDAVITARRAGATAEDLLNVAEELCVDLEIESQDVCHGAIESHLSPVLWIIDNKLDLNGARVCTIFLQQYGCDSLEEPDWTVALPAGYSPEKTESSSNEEPVTFLHLSDFHLDNMYTPGGNALCPDPLCCQSDQEGPETEEAACGYWGDYRSSDVPIYTITNAIQQSTVHNPDFVIYTGDVITHRLWSTSVEKNQKDLVEIYELLDAYYDVPVYPVLGNHEPHPLNVWSPEETTGNASTQWVFDLVAEQWSRWLPNDTQSTIEKGGYYTVVHRTGLRIIALNSNVCYTMNWFLVYNDIDPFDQLAWLVTVLQDAENKGEAVLILGHIPSNDNSCWKVWSREFRKIVDRFANTIAGQLYGHTHSDIWSVYYNASQPTQAVNLGINGASVVTHTHKNPSYKLYYLDAENYEILDYDEYTFNLTEANLNPSVSPNWFKLYSFKEAYGVNSMRPSDLNELVLRFATDKTLLEQYFRFKIRMADTALASGCDDSCHKSNLCGIVRSEFGDTERCEELSEIYDQTVLGK